MTRENRLLATDAAKDAITAGGGWIENFQLFSNKMTSIHFEMPADALPAFIERLAALRMQLDEDALVRARDASRASGDLRVTLQITFIHDEPDLRREVLAVPG